MVKQTSRRASRSDGIHSRETILNAAARLATIEGLEGMSIGRLAEHIGMSKSGLYAHFGSKEELQIATVETASEIFRREVIEPTASLEDPIDRLLALADAFLSHLERDVFPGGCFFVSATAEFDTRPGPVLNMVSTVIQNWGNLFSSLVQQAQAEDKIRKDEDPDQLAWELDAFLLMGNMGWVVLKTEMPLERARQAFRTRLAQSQVATRAGAK